MSEPIAKVYRNFSADELQAQYSARAAVPEHPAIFERWAADSAAYRDAASVSGRARLDLAYGEHSRERIDVFLPEAGGEAPLHVFFHGGYWQSLQRSNFSFIAAAMNAAGLAVAVVGYPLCPEVDLQRIVSAARSAIVWLATAKIPGIRATPMHVAGHSAGGHLTAMIATTDWSNLDSRLPARLLNGIAPISGVFDLEPIVHTRINDALHLDVETARGLSAPDAAPQPECKLNAFVGAEESDEFKRQSEAFAEAWQQRGGDAPVVQHVAGCNHFTVLDVLYAPDGPMIAAARAAIG